MWPLTPQRERRTSVPESFQSSAKKDFFNTIRSQLAVAPIEFAALLIEDDLLRSVGRSLRDDRLAVLAVDVGALDGSVIQAWDAHIGPVDMASLGIDDDAIGQMAIRHDGLAGGTVRIHRGDLAGVQLKEKETGG